VSTLKRRSLLPKKISNEPTTIQQRLSFQEALLRCQNLLANSDRRTIIGIVGKPGAGKSMLSNFLIENLPKESVALLPMDGFHLSNARLAKLGRADRKGSPDTFDSFGFAALLERISNSTNDDIFFPVFHREIEESIAAEGVIKADTRLIITEGNYLLHQEGGWASVFANLTESWYVEVNDTLRLNRLVDRHHFYGKDRQSAYDWAHGTDERNAQLVESTKSHADFLVINSDEFV
jgi:pantothenate kinase